MLGQHTEQRTLTQAETCKEVDPATTERALVGRSGAAEASLNSVSAQTGGYKISVITFGVN